MRNMDSRIANMTVRMTLIGIIFLFTSLAHADSLHRAIRQHESGGYRYARGRHGEAGDLQIRPCVVRDCNRIVGRQKWTLQDRYNPRKAKEMYDCYLNHYGRQYTRMTGRKPSNEVLARIWNGGPNGWRSRRTLGYWRDVRALM